MTIDRLLPESWPPETLAAMERWRQGHLIKMDRGAWIVPAWVDDPVTGEPSAGGAVGEARARSAPLSDTGYAAVVSQTCDIAGGPARRHPLVQVCPVRDISSFPPEKIQQVKDRLVSEYVWLSKPPVEGAQWAVDLRAMVSVSKGLLAAVEPIEGFASIEDELILGQRLASKLARPAVHDALAGPVFDALRKFIAKAKKSQVWCDDVEQLRLEVVEGLRCIEAGAAARLDGSQVRARREEAAAGRVEVPQEGVEGRWHHLGINPLRYRRQLLGEAVPRHDSDRGSHVGTGPVRLNIRCLVCRHGFAPDPDGHGCPPMLIVEDPRSIR